MAKRIYNQQALFGPLYAFLVVISPPENVRNEIAGIKHRLNDVAPIGGHSLTSVGHITITDKLTDDSDFANVIAKLITGIKPFKVSIGGIGIFDHSAEKKSVYLKVKDHQPIVNVMEAVKAKSKFPHLQLAKYLSSKNLESLAPELQNINYAAEWQCTEIIVLKKLMSEKHLGWRERIAISLVH